MAFVTLDGLDVREPMPGFHGRFIDVFHPVREDYRA